MSCKKCQNKQCTCVNQGCKAVDAKCVVYTGNDLDCIAPIAPNTTLDVILKEWNDYFCGLFESAILECVKEPLGIPASTETLSHTALLTYIQRWICNLADVNVKVTPEDTTSGYLYDKVSVGDCIEKSIKINETTGAQTLHLSLNFGCIAQQIPLCFEIETPPCFEVIGGGGNPCTPSPLTPFITRSGLVLTGTNCNGTLQWYNEQDVLIGVGASITVEANKKYYAKCQNNCGLSANSNVITVPPINTYTRVRKATFRRNNCGDNGCNIPCSGSSIEFERVYTSNISQADADAKAETDTTFATDGQNQANTLGTCTCPDCNCQFPTYNPTIIVNNATCNGNVIQANGQITIGGIAHADRFGYSFGPGDYSGVSYASANKLINFASGNIETTPTSIKLKALSIETRVVFRIFNGANNCWTDIVVTHNPQDCTVENVEIGDVSVSCEVVDSICKSWTIVAGNAVSKVVYYNCNTQQYVFEDQAANTTVSRCSSITPVATGAVVTEIGVC